MQSGTDDQKEYAAAALWNLAYDNDENQGLIVQAGAIAPLVTLVQSGTDGQKENATGALQSLFIASPASPVGSPVAGSRWMWPPAGSGVALLIFTRANAGLLATTRWPEAWISRIGTVALTASRSARLGWRFSSRRLSS